MEEQIFAVRRMQRYIAEHLYENISPDDLAAAARYSPWHSYRLFIRWLKITPAHYIRRLRLSKSALLLRDGDSTITDVAFLVGFNSVDGYQRAFYREFGCNPGAYAENPVPIFLFTPYEAYSKTLKENKTMEKTSIVFVETVQKPARKVIVKRGIRATEYFAYCEEVGCDVWGLLQSIKSLGGEPVCLWLPDSLIPPHTSPYVQGAEVPLDYNGVVPEGFETIDLPAAQYLSFRGEPFRDEDYEEAIMRVREAIERYDPAPSGLVWDKDNPRIQLEPLGERGYIELLPVRPAR